MGIRVHKVIGYGIDNLRTVRRDKYHRDVADERVLAAGSTKAKPISILRYREEETSGEAFAKWIESNMATLVPLVEREYGPLGELDHNHGRVVLKRRNGTSAKNARSQAEANLRLAAMFVSEKNDLTSVMNCVHHCTEGGLRNVVVFQIPNEPTHYRRDDMIDHVEEQNEDGLISRVERLRGGIYPHIGDVVLPGKARLSSRDFGMAVGTWSKSMRPVITDRAERRNMLARWRPPVPAALIALVVWLEPKDPIALIDALRPLLYVYWE